MKKLKTLTLVTLIILSHLAVKAQTLNVNGLEREYKIHVPADLTTETKVPVIIALHPLGSNNTNFENTTQFSLKADQEGFIVAYPQGIGNSWNAGACCNPAANDNVDDIGFISLLIDTLIENYPIDTNRVFIAGFSNGAILAYALASEISEKIDGIAAVGGLLAQADNNATHAIPIIHIHALYDNAVHITGEFGFPSVYSLLDDWKTINGIVAEPDTFRDDSGVKGILYVSPDNSSNIVLYTTETGAHAWTPSSRLATTKRIWEFFSTGTNKQILINDTITEGPRKRDYKIHIPDAYFETVAEEKKFALIIAAHGWDQTAEDMEEMTGFSSLGNIKGFFVNYLHYVGPPPDMSWNYNMTVDKPDDISYARAVIDTMLARYPIDSNKIYAVGFSDGCGMANRLPFETNGLISAIGTVGGMVTFDSQVTTNPVRMMHFHSKSDPAVSFSSVRNTNLPYWLDVNNCSETPDTVLNASGYYGEVFTNADGDSSVLFITLPWWLHDWPVINENSMKLSASNLMWKFFETGMAIPNIATDPVSLTDQNKETGILAVYPNPAQGFLKIKTNLSADDALSFSIIQSDGKEIYRSERQVYSGEVETELQLQQINKGYYTLVIRSDSFQRTVGIALY